VTTILVLQLEVNQKVQMSGGIQRHDFHKSLMKIDQLLQDSLGVGDERMAVAILQPIFSLTHSLTELSPS
jgi:hypothetical protein